MYIKLIYLKGFVHIPFLYIIYGTYCSFGWVYNLI